jgi:peptidoglycan/LPS O-acetylase OafA/YrhL
MLPPLGDNNPRVHFFNLDILRFFAAFMIVIMHGYRAVLEWTQVPEVLLKNTSNRIYQEENLNHTGLFLKRLIDNFDLGVEFFFLISGFLITYLLLSEMKSTGKIDIVKFYLRRLLRIWPLYFLIIALTPFIQIWTDSPHPNYLWSVFFVNNYASIFHGQFEIGLAHLWSICIEEHFYLFWPVLIFLIPKPKLPLLFASIICISFFFKWYYYQFYPNWDFHLKLNTLCRMDTLAIGAWIAWYALKKNRLLNFSIWIRLIVFITFFILICFVDTHHFATVFEAMFLRLIFTLLFVFILLNYLFNPNVCFNFKKKNALHYLGKISFGIYMYHNILFGLLFQKVIWPFKLEGFWWFWLIYLSAIAIISILSFEILEKPILKFKDRFAIVPTRS